LTKKYLIDKRHKMKKHLIPITIIVLVLGSILFFGYNTHGEKNETESNYSTINVQRRTIEQYVSATGIVKPKVGAEVKVGAQISGIVKKLYVEIGSRVKRGELLAEIESSGYKAKFEMALAQKKTAETEKIFAEYELKRSLSLKEKGGITQQQLENAQKLFELSSSRLDQAIADMNYADLQLSYTKILSPIDGVVASITTQEGETVSASFVSPTFVTVINLDRLEVWAYVDETDIGKIQKDQKVTFYVDTYPGKSIEGKVKTIFPDAEIKNNVVNYVVVITIGEHPELTLRPQMDANANIYTQYKKDVLTIPKKAVQFDESGSKFIELLVNGKKEKRIISVGISDDKFYEVLSGVTPGDKIILN